LTTTISPCRISLCRSTPGNKSVKILSNARRLRGHYDSVIMRSQPFSGANRSD